jgi:hypothetical protein
MATNPSGNGGYAMRCCGSPNRVQPKSQATETEPGLACLAETEDIPSHWHNVTAIFSTQHERTASQSLGQSPLLIEKTRVLESRGSAMAEAIASCTWSSAPALSAPRKRAYARNSNENSSRRCERRCVGITARTSAGPDFDSSQ